MFSLLANVISEFGVSIVVTWVFSVIALVWERATHLDTKSILPHKVKGMVERLVVSQHNTSRVKA